MSGQMLTLQNIAGGDFSDWVSGTSAYVVPNGYEAYGFQPGASGATISAASWITNPRQANTVVAVTDTYKSLWLNSSVTTGPIIFLHPVTTLTLSAGDGLIFCRKSNHNPS